MTNRAGPSFYEHRQAENFPTTGRPPDRNWMDMKRVRPRWTGHETRNTMDQLVGRKRRADDDTLLMPCIEVPDAGRMPWDDPHKRILFESEDPDSTSSGSGIQEARPKWPPRQWVSKLDPVQGVNRRSRPGRITVTGIYVRAKTAKIAKKIRGSKGGVKIPTC